MQDRAEQSGDDMVRRGSTTTPLLPHGAVLVGALAKSLRRSRATVERARRDLGLPPFDHVAVPGRQGRQAWCGKESAEAIRQWVRAADRRALERVPAGAGRGLRGGDARVRRVLHAVFKKDKADEFKDNLDLMAESIHGDEFTGTSDDRALVHVLRALRSIPGAGHIVPEIAKAIIEAGAMDAAAGARRPRAIMIEGGRATVVAAPECARRFAFVIGSELIDEGLASTDR